jgi:hypothetical protein
METLRVIVDVLMWVGAPFWLLSICFFLQTRFVGSKPEAKPAWPFYLYKRHDLTEEGQRSQRRVVLFRVPIMLG